MCSTTSSGVVLSHDGGVRRYGRAEEAEAGSALNRWAGETTYRYPFRERAYDPWLLCKIVRDVADTRRARTDFGGVRAGWAQRTVAAMTRDVTRDMWLVTLYSCKP